MPVYEYKCDECGFHFDALRSMKDADSALECKKCASKKTHRMLSHCFSHSEGQNAGMTQQSGCGGCSGGSCASCRH